MTGGVRGNGPRRQNHSAQCETRLIWGGVRGNRPRRHLLRDTEDSALHETCVAAQTLMSRPPKKCENQLKTRRTWQATLIPVTTRRTKCPDGRNREELMCGSALRRKVVVSYNVRQLNGVIPSQIQARGMAHLEINSTSSVRLYSDDEARIQAY